jgi:Haemolymph juvenile hormone binding protein (JHBP)
MQKFDPYYTETFLFNKSTVAYDTNGTVTDSFITGMSKAKCVKFTGLDQNLVKFDILTPVIIINGSLSFYIKLMGIPVEGTEDMNLSFCKICGVKEPTEISANINVTDYH